MSGPDLLAFAETDYGNAERLHALYGGSFRFCEAHGWLTWDGKRWTADDGEATLLRFALETARQLFDQANAQTNPKTRSSWIKHALNCERTTALRNAVDLAKSIPGVTVRADQLDSDPYLLTVENGTLDLKTGTLRPHDPKDLITKLAPVTFDPSADCPRWTAFQSQICDGDEDLVAFKQRATGYSLTGATSEHVLFIGFGTGANGKSTELDALTAILGDYATTAQADTFAVRRHEGVRDDLADLAGARFVSASEGESGLRLAEGLVKQLTGGDRIRARRLYQAAFVFRPAFKIWLATNHKPAIRGTDEGIWRRIRLIPYAVTIPKTQRDHALSAKLEAERSGILNWLLTGCLIWQADGLGTAAAVEAATESYRTESDVLANFITDCCETGAGCQDSFGNLYQRYDFYCSENGDQPFSKTLFGKMLEERGYPLRLSRIGGAPVRTRLNICLIENAPDGRL